MSESKQEPTPQQKSSHLQKMPGFTQVRPTYQNVRPFVKETVKEELANNEYADRQNAQRIAFKTAEKMSPLVYKDLLTDLPNRKWFLERLEKKIARIDRNMLNKQLPFPTQSFAGVDTEIYLVISDIDKFKAINDGLGHSVGDEILKLMKKLPTRPEEEIARYGGEEFFQMIEIPKGTPPDQIITILQTITNRSSNQIGTDSEEMLKDKEQLETYHEEVQKRITLSFGITKLLPGDTAETAIKRADKGLYRAKAEGRNQAILVDTISPTTDENLLSFRTIYNGNAEIKAA